MYGGGKNCIDYNNFYNNRITYGVLNKLCMYACWCVLAQIRFILQVHVCVCLTISPLDAV